jgi:hypothetical protein
VLTVAEGDDEGVIDGADGSAGFVGNVAASTSTCRSLYKRGRPQVVTPGSAAAPLPLLGAARLRGGSACHRPLWGALRSVPWLAVVRVAVPITEFGVESCPQFVIMAAVAPSSLGVAVNNHLARVCDRFPRTISIQGAQRLARLLRPASHESP